MSFRGAEMVCGPTVFVSALPRVSPSRCSLHKQKWLSNFLHSPHISFPCRRWNASSLLFPLTLIAPCATAGAGHVSPYHTRTHAYEIKSKIRPLHMHIAAAAAARDGETTRANVTFIPEGRRHRLEQQGSPFFASFLAPAHVKLDWKNPFSQALPFIHHLLWGGGPG